MSDKKEKSIYDLELHGYMNIGNSVTVTRVPGGWIYYDYTTNSRTSTFVPMNREFHPKQIEMAKDIVNHIEEELELTKVWCKDCDLANICTLKLKQYTNAVTCPEYRDNLPF